MQKEMINYSLWKMQRKLYFIFNTLLRGIIFFLLLLFLKWVSDIKRFLSLLCVFLLSKFYFRYFFSLFVRFFLLQGIHYITNDVPLSLVNHLLVQYKFMESFKNLSKMTYANYLAGKYSGRQKEMGTMQILSSEQGTKTLKTR